MPISLSQLQRLQDFKKHTCEQCACDYYSSRESRWCSPRCKQAGYRNRLLQNEESKSLNVIGFKSMNEAQKIAPTVSKITMTDTEDKSELMLAAAKQRYKQVIKN